MTVRLWPKANAYKAQNPQIDQTGLKAYIPVRF